MTRCRGAEYAIFVVANTPAAAPHPKNIDRIYVRPQTLCDPAFQLKVTESVTPRELNHFDQRRSVSITAVWRLTFRREAFVSTDQTVAASAVRIQHRTLNGTRHGIQEFARRPSRIVFVLALFIFPVAGRTVQESLVDPLVIMLSMIGALLALKKRRAVAHSADRLITLRLITKHAS
jgi:multidrug efflux pump